MSAFGRRLCLEYYKCHYSWIHTEVADNMFGMCFLCWNSSFATSTERIWFIFIWMTKVASFWVVAFSISSILSMRWPFHHSAWHIAVLLPNWDADTEVDERSFFSISPLFKMSTTTHNNVCVSRWTMRCEETLGGGNLTLLISNSFFAFQSFRRTYLSLCHSFAFTLMHVKFGLAVNRRMTWMQLKLSWSE